MGALRGSGHFVARIPVKGREAANVLLLVGISSCLRPTGAPSEAITSHEVTAPREVGPSGRTASQSGPVRQDSISKKNKVENRGVFLDAKTMTA